MSTNSSGKKRVIAILMRRDGLSQSEAEAMLNDTLEQVEAAIAQGDTEGAEDIWMGDLGLEVDFLLDII